MARRPCSGPFITLLALIALSVTGCPRKNPAPSWLSGTHQGYPRTHYLVGSGHSADGYAEAEAAARAEVARQIASEIEVLVNREAEVVTEGDRVRAHSSVEQVISERSTFDHAELMQIPHDGRFADRDGFWAFACLTRSDADGVLAIEQQALEAELADLRGRIVGAVADGDPPRLARAIGPFREAHAAWSALRFQRRAIAGGSGGDADAVRAMASEVAAAHKDLMDRIVWLVRVEGASADVPAEAVAAAEHVLVEALSAMELTVQLTDRSPCSARPADRDLVYGLTARLDARQSLGQIGPQATIDLAVEAVVCQGDANALFTRSLPGVVGVHATRSDRALEIAVDKLLAAEDGIRTDLAGPIGTAVPLP